MSERAVRGLQFISLQLVGAVAVIHFAVGSEQLATIITNGLLAEYLVGRVLERPRPVLFLTSSVAIGAGVIAAGRGWIDRRTAYQLGLLAMITYLGSWFAWHTILDHGLALSGGAGTENVEHSHGGLVATFASHYITPLGEAVGAATSDTGSPRTALGIASVTLEVIALITLSILLKIDPSAEEGGITIPPQIEAPER